MARDILGDDPVAVDAVEAFGQDFELGPDRFVGIGYAPGVRAADQPLDKARDLHPFLLEDLVVPDDIDGGRGMKM